MNENLELDLDRMDIFDLKECAAIHDRFRTAIFRALNHIKRNGWTSVLESLPESGDVVQVWTESNKLLMATWNGSWIHVDLCEQINLGRLRSVTHWRPIVGPNVDDGSVTGL